MTYSVKEIFLTLQGEGANTGRVAVFCRFTGCNLWSGVEKDRDGAICNFCDTNFVGTDGPGGGRFSNAGELAAAVRSKWPNVCEPGCRPLVVCTGGEPLLQMDEALVSAFHEAGFEIAIETNGTQPPPTGIDWVCVSPKAGTDLVLRSGHELKFVYPQRGAEPDLYVGLNFDHFFLQPMDGPMQAENTQLAIDYCLRNPKWRLSLQTHKMMGIP